MPRFFRKLCASTLKRFYIFFKNGFSVGRSYDLTFLFDWRHSIDKKVALRLYENKQLMLYKGILQDLKPGFIFDIGAHSGLYSLLARKVCPDAEIHAFEPDKQNLSQLYANLYLNAYYDNINVHNVAISTESGKAHLSRSDDTSRATRHISKSGAYQVDVIRFDDKFMEQGKTAFFKIDVEGHELSVIEGAKEFLKHNKCILIVESREPEFYKLQGEMEKLGYSLKDFNDDKLDHVFLNFDFSFKRYK